MQSLITAGDSRHADTAFFYAMLACGFSVIAIVGLIVYELVTKSSLSWHAFGLKFFFRSEWDPVNDQYGALPFVYGTIVSSILALIIAVPLAIGVAVYITEMSPRWLRGALAFTTELLAAIPSVIYGLWAIFVLVPLLRQYLQPWLAKYSRLDRICLRGRPTASACWRRESFWRSWWFPSSPRLRARS